MSHTLVHLLRRSSQTWPLKDALVQGDRRLSYADLWRAAQKLAGHLSDNGLGRGARVSLLMENSPEYAIAYYGVLLAGGVVVALNTTTKVRDLANWISHSGSRCLIADGRHPELSALKESLRDIDLIVNSEAAERKCVTTFQDILRAFYDVGDLRMPDGSEVASIIYTSGTTGRPKGVVLSHNNLCANALSILEYLGLTSEDSIVNVLPFYYSYGNSVLHTHLAVGAKIVIENSMLYPRRLLETIVREQVTGFSGVPSTFSLLLNRTKLSDFDLSRIRYITQAGGAMAPASIERIRREIPNAQFFVMYGQTEASARLTYLPPTQLDSKKGSVGIGIPGVTISIRDDTGNEVPKGTIGEVWARGANIMQGYWRDSEATSRTLVAGWLRTGDLAYQDRDSYLYIIGRSSEMIKSGAHRISPKDIEEVILELVGIEEAVVVGVPDEVLGQAIKAVVVRAPNSDIDAKAILRHCRNNLAVYKIPKVVEFAEHIPKTASGKIRRFMLQN